MLALINWLHDIEASHSSFYGPKASNLGEMMKFGMPVPDGFVFAEPNPTGYIEAGNLYDTKLGGKVAVRSSGIAEDGEETSFAGIHDTFLDVEGKDEVIFSIAI